MRRSVRARSSTGVRIAGRPASAMRAAPRANDGHRGWELLDLLVDMTKKSRRTPREPSSGAAGLPSGRRAELLHLVPHEAPGEVVVHNAAGLHCRVGGRGADEAEPALLQLLAER